MKFRKKPVVIDAVPWSKPGDHAAVVSPVPEGVEITPAALGSETPSQFRLNHGAIHTLEGWMLVTPGDYIIRGIQGEYYPCKPEIFAATYEPAE